METEIALETNRSHKVAAGALGVVGGGVVYFVAATLYFATYQLGSGTMPMGNAGIAVALVGLGLLLSWVARRHPLAGMAAAGLILVVCALVLLQPNNPIPLLDTSHYDLHAVLQLGARTYLAPLLSVALIAGALEGYRALRG